MKILLASNGKFLIEQGYQLFGIPKEKIHIGWVTTASKGEEKLDYLERHRRAMQDFGYKFEEFDIEGKTKEEILTFFADKNVIHVEGGNTFYLLKAIKETGFDEILKTLLDGGLMYGGTSAGAYVMCPVIEVSTWGPKVKSRYGLTDLTALHYVPFCLLVHYTDDEENLAREKMKTLDYPLLVLRDGQGILAENGIYTFVGEGEEVRLD